MKQNFDLYSLDLELTIRSELALEREKLVIMEELEKLGIDFLEPELRIKYGVPSKLEFSILHGPRYRYWLLSVHEIFDKYLQYPLKVVGKVWDPNSDKYISHYYKTWTEYNSLYVTLAETSADRGTFDAIFVFNDTEKTPNWNLAIMIDKEGNITKFDLSAFKRELRFENIQDYLSTLKENNYGAKPEDKLILLNLVNYGFFPDLNEDFWKIINSKTTWKRKIS